MDRLYLFAISLASSICFSLISQEVTLAPSEAKAYTARLSPQLSFTYLSYPHNITKLHSMQYRFFICLFAVKL